MLRTWGQAIACTLLPGTVAWASAGLAVAAPVSGVRISGIHDSAVVKVHRRAGHNLRHYRRGRIVDAPFTYVETGRRVVVDAPFATVYVGRHGRYVRAPFVNIWIPR